MTRLIGAELFKLRKRLMTWVLLAVLCGILILVNLLLLAVSKVILPTANVGPHSGQIQNLLGLSVALPVTMSFLSSFGSVLAVILLASSMGSEYNWKTIRTAVISSESRFKLLGAKLISAVILVLIAMVIGMAVGFIMSIITTAIGGYKFDFSFATGTYLWDQFLQFWRTFYVLLPYMLLGFLLSIVGRSAMPGIALGIGVIFLEGIVTAFMTLAGGWIAKVPQYLIADNVRAITSLNMLPQGFGGGTGFGNSPVNLPGVTHAAIILAIYIGAFLVISFWLFKKRDVTG